MPDLPKLSSKQVQAIEQNTLRDMEDTVRDIGRRHGKMYTKQRQFLREIETRDGLLEQNRREIEKELQYLKNELGILKKRMKKTLFYLEGTIAELRSRASKEDLSELEEQFGKMGWDRAMTTKEMRKDIWRLLDSRPSEMFKQ